MTRLVFVGISGYDYPHTRVRCYHFAHHLAKYFHQNTAILSFRDHLGQKFSEIEMWGLPEKEKIKLTVKAFAHLIRNTTDTFYIQKIHYHAAAPLFLSRIGMNYHIFDYDDYDVELTVPFKSRLLNRIFLGSNDHYQMVRIAAETAQFCVGASHFLVDFLKQFNTTVHYIPTGVDTRRFINVDRSNRENPVILLWNGVIWGEEILASVLTALRIFRICYLKTKNIKFRIAACGQYLDRVLETIRTDYRELADAIEIVPWVSPDRMPEILGQADIGLLPLASQSRWVQSKSPTKLFEYMSTGLPVVAFNNGEARFVIDHQKDGYLADSEEDFGDYLMQLINNPSLRTEMGFSARKKIESKFSLDFICEVLYWCMLRNY